MSKEGEINFPKMQTHVLKVRMHCEGCKLKVEKLLEKINGVRTISIQSEEGKVTVSGHVDPAALIQELAKKGKHAELFDPKGDVGSKTARVPESDLKNQFQIRNGGGGNIEKKERQQKRPSSVRSSLIRKLKDLKLPFSNDGGKYVKLESSEEVAVNNI